MDIWTHWWNALSRLRPAFSYKATFLWFALIVAGLCVRRDLLGVTSIVRALGLRPALYSNLLHNIHSTAIDLDKLSSLWTQTAIELFPDPLSFNGRRVLVADGIKIPKQGAQDACRQVAASIQRFEHQGRIHHGPFTSGDIPTRERWLKRFCSSLG